MAETITITDAARQAEPETVREAGGALVLNLRELWQYRDLLRLLVWRNVVVLYKQSVIGVGWALIRPLVSMVVFTLIFGKVARLDEHTEGVPYSIFTFVALLPWQYFSGCVTGAGGSLVSESYIMTKVYFPRLIMPLSKLFAGLVDFAVGFVVLIGLMIWYHDKITLTWGILLLPVFLLLAMLCGLAFGLWLTALSVKYRDFVHLTPFLVQVWTYLAPVAYPSTMVPAKYLLLYNLNPMVAVIDGFRWALLGQAPPSFACMGLGCAVTALVLVSGLYYFRKVEALYADLV